MRNELLKVGVRNNAIYIPTELLQHKVAHITETTSVLVANVSRLGFTFSEPLLHALNGVNPAYKLSILEYLKQLTGVDHNWTPLIKNWIIPTGESVVDHVKTFFTNSFKSQNGTHLQCGHVIPYNSFPLDSYNGCPYCGTPFEFSKIEIYGQGSKLKVLELWSDIDLEAYFISLLQSKTALDATQVESLKILMNNLEIPKAEIEIKETLMLVIDYYLLKNEAHKVQIFLQNPTDILRYLWFKKTGFLQIIEPKTIIKNESKLNRHLYQPLDKSANAKTNAINKLKLKYSRTECKAVAGWLNNLSLEVEKSCEIMHTKRGMWVRLIRALRLAEYSKRKGFEKLADLLDVFYNQTYTVWQGEVNNSRLKYDAQRTFTLLKQRPGIFARSLFPNMLWFGPDETIKAFNDVVDKVPTRLVFTLNMYANNYFDASIQRAVKTLGGVTKRIPSNKLNTLYAESQLKSMKSQIEDLCLLTVLNKFSKVENSNSSIYIDPILYNMPIPIGDRASTIQDAPSALMGTKFPLEGDNVRLYMQWGKGMPAQHLDMDLSCRIIYDHKIDLCSYSNLHTLGAMHSGDIRSIPNKIGTAEYIDINLIALQNAKAKYVVFTCNAYSNGGITPNLRIGWMNAAYKMHVSEYSGVAYDPSCVQHEVSVTQNVSKGLVFGVLDVKSNQITWLELPFDGQVTQNLDIKSVEALVSKLNSKLSIGAILELKADAQNLEIVNDIAEANEVYTKQWALNAAQVTQLLID